MASSSPTAPAAAVVPAPETHTVAFTSNDVPITAVTVFCEDKAEVTRIVNFSTSSAIGPHEVELTELPGGSVIDKASVRVKGSGHCTILHVSYSDEANKIAEPELTAEEKEAVEAEKERQRQELQQLSDDQTVLNRTSARNQRMRELADKFAQRVVIATAGGSANGAVATGYSDHPAPSVGDVSKALDWWAAKAVQTDTETHRLDLEDRRLKGAIAELRSAPSIAIIRPQPAEAQNKPPGRILVSIDVHELGPIELEVRYMTRGATWSPAYDLRVDTETDSLSCTYFGRVTQSTTEDWKGVVLRLSTAEPTVHGTPPVLGLKTVSVKAPPQPPAPMYRNPGMKMKKQRSRRSSSFAESEEDEEGECHYGGAMPSMAAMVGGRGGGGPGMSRAAPSAPPPPPVAKPAVAQVETGGGGIGAVTFVVGKPAVIKSNGQTKKLTIGELQLSAEVTHYVVPSKDPAAYLQAKATNDTDYLLLASDDVSIFFGNSFATKTSLESVSPGETFQAFLGIDPTVKINVAPPRKATKKRGIFSKSNHVTYSQSTSIANNKKVPVTCVVVGAMPRSTDEVIKVTLKQPLPTTVAESEAITDDVLVSEALEMFGGTGEEEGGEGSSDDFSRSRSSSSRNFNRRPSGAASRVTGVVKNPSSHLAWVGKIAPQGELSIPLEYVMEWPTGKEIEIRE
eukprot:jgi/Undpi1/13951/HiC_scaffold_9.g03602.m1